MEALADAKALGASEDWEKMIRGILALYSGDAEQAETILRGAISDIPDGAPNRVAIHSALATALMFMGKTDDCLKVVSELKGMTPVTPEDHLLKGQIFGCLPNLSEEGRTLIEKYFDQDRRSAIARVVRAMAKLVAADVETDISLIEEAEFDSQVAVEMMPDSVVAQLTRVLVHHRAWDIYTRVNEQAQADQHRQSAIEAINAMSVPPGFASAHTNACISSIGLATIRVHPATGSSPTMPDCMAITSQTTQCLNIGIHPPRERWRYSKTKNDFAAGRAACGPYCHLTKPKTEHVLLKR